MYNAEYHEQSECIDDELLKDFIEHSNVLSEVHRCRQYSHIDYYGKDIKGRDVNIELKKRNNKMNKYATTYIECSKAWTLLEQYEQYHRIPLYINFFDDGIIIFKLNVTDFLGAVPIKQKIWNHGYEEYQTAWRYELDNDSGFRYIKINGQYQLVDGEMRQIIKGS